MSVIVLFLYEIASRRKEILETSCSYLIHDLSEKKVLVTSPDEQLERKAERGPSHAKSQPPRALSILGGTVFEWFSWEHPMWSFLEGLRCTGFIQFPFHWWNNCINFPTSWFKLHKKGEKKRLLFFVRLIFMSVLRFVFESVGGAFYKLPQQCFGPRGVSNLFFKKMKNNCMPFWCLSGCQAFVSKHSSKWTSLCRYVWARMWMYARGVWENKLCWVDLLRQVPARN